MTWIYFLGETTTGKTIKIGRSDGEVLAKRVASVNAGQHSAERYALLAGTVGEPRAEKAVTSYFEHLRLDDRGSRREYFRAEPELVEYILWLRQQHWVTFDESTTEAELPCEDVNHWLPRPDRRVQPPPAEEDELFSKFRQWRGPLAGTAWDWVPDPLASFQDYFTPPPIVKRAWEAMGGIDLDAASHFLANRDLREAGIIIPRYFSASFSGHEHPWSERVWLNPPYGDYLPWFEDIDREMAEGRTEQVCMISPAWAFITKQARPFVAKASGMLLLSPTPQFKNPGNPNLTGRNDPHLIVYWGSRLREFFAAFADVGYPCLFPDVEDGPPQWDWS